MSSRSALPAACGILAAALGTAAAHLVARFEPPQHVEQLAPGGQAVFALQQPAEHHAVAAQQVQLDTLELVVDQARALPQQHVGAGLAADVVAVGGREGSAAGPRGHRGESVGGPVVGDVGPPALDVVAFGGEVVGDAQRGELAGGPSGATWR